MDCRRDDAVEAPSGRCFPPRGVPVFSCLSVVDSLLSWTSGSLLKASSTKLFRFLLTVDNQGKSFWSLSFLESVRCFALLWLTELILSKSVCSSSLSSSPFSSIPIFGCMSQISHTKANWQLSLRHRSPPLNLFYSLNYDRVKFTSFACET